MTRWQASDREHWRRTLLRDAIGTGHRERPRGEGPPELLPLYTALGVLVRKVPPAELSRAREACCDAYRALASRDWLGSATHLRTLHAILGEVQPVAGLAGRYVAAAALGLPPAERERLLAGFRTLPAMGATEPLRRSLVDRPEVRRRSLLRRIVDFFRPYRPPDEERNSP